METIGSRDLKEQATEILRRVRTQRESFESYLSWARHRPAGAHLTVRPGPAVRPRILG